MVAALWIEGTVAATPSEITLSLVILQDVISLIAACLLLFASFVKCDVNRYVRNLYLAAMLMLIFAMTVFFMLRTNITIVITEAIIRAAVCFIQYILWALIVKNEKDGTHLSTWPALFVGALGFSWICEQCLTSILGHYVHLDAVQSNICAFLVVIAILAFCGYFFIRHVRSDNEPQKHESMANLTKREVVEDLAAQYGLSEQEEVILFYRAKGYSTKKIAETLCIAEGTVIHHLKNVHSKLGIHSKDELIKLVENAEIERLYKEKEEEK